MTSDTHTFGQILAGARAAAGVAQGDLAKALGLSTSFVSDVEHDRRALDRAFWLNVVEALRGKVSILDLASAEVRTRAVRVVGADLRPASRAQLVVLVTELAKRRK